MKYIRSAAIQVSLRNRRPHLQVMYCTSYTNISALRLLGTPVITILKVRSANQPAIKSVALCQTLLTAFIWALIAGFLNVKKYLYWKMHSTFKFSTSYCLKLYQTPTTVTIQAVIPNSK